VALLVKWLSPALVSIWATLLATRVSVPSAWRTATSMQMYPPVTYLGTALLKV